MLLPPGHNRHSPRKPVPGNPALAGGGPAQIQPPGWTAPPLVQKSKANLDILFSRHFVVEASGEAVANDYNSVFSRLVLCKTFRLEEDGKVCTPHQSLQTNMIFIYIQDAVTGLEPGGVALSMCSPSTADP